MGRTVPGVSHAPKPHAAPRRADASTRGPKKRTPVIANMAAHDAAIEVFITDASRADSTKKRDAKYWRLWTDHCATLGVDPEVAPYSAYRELFLLRRQDGRPMGTGTLQNIASAVLHHYTRLDRVPAHKLPENAGDWRDQMKSAKRAEGQRRADGQPPQAEIVPLLRPQLQQLMLAEPAPSPHHEIARAAVLLAVDLHASRSLTQVLRLRAEDVQVVSDGPAAGGVVIHGALLACDHRERVPGVPWDCTACAVRGVLAARGGDGPLLTCGGNGLRNARHAFEHLLLPSRHSRRTDFAPRPDLTPWQLAGLRRGLVIRVGVPNGARWIRARTWTLTSWVCGFRMCSDLVRLDRSAVVPDPAGRGWRIRLGVTKADQESKNEVVRALCCGTTSRLSPAHAMSEYLCVRDAAVGGRGGALLCALANGNGAASQFARPAASVATKALDASRSDLAYLCALAGLPAVYSSYSIRKGYAQQAEKDGWPIEDIQEGLRHAEVETTAGYLGEGSANAAATKFIRALDGDRA